MPGALGVLVVALLGTAPAARPAPAPPPPLAIPALPPVPAPRVTCDAERLLLGEPRASVRCSVEHAAGETLRAATNVGTLVPEGLPTKGAQRFVYTAPAERVPRVALLAFWRDAAATAVEPPEVALIRLPLFGRQTLTVATRPGAQVEVVLGTRRFGPVAAAADGAAHLDVEVPPKATAAVVHARSAGQVREDQLPLEVPASNPLLAVLLPETLAPGQSAWLWVLHQDRLPGKELEFAYRGLTFERLRFQRDRGLFKVTAKPDAREARLEIRLAGSPEASVLMESLLSP